MLIRLLALVYSVFLQSFSRFLILVEQAIAQAAGQTAIVAAMLAALILTVAVKIMGLPVEVKLGAGDQRADGNLAQRI